MTRRSVSSFWTGSVMDSTSVMNVWATGKQICEHTTDNWDSGRTLVQNNERDRPGEGHRPF